MADIDIETYKLVDNKYEKTIKFNVGENVYLGFKSQIERIDLPVYMGVDNIDTDEKVSYKSFGHCEIDLKDLDKDKSTCVKAGDDAYYRFILLDILGPEPYEAIIPYIHDFYTPGNYYTDIYCPGLNVTNKKFEVLKEEPPEEPPEKPPSLISSDYIIYAVLALVVIVIAYLILTKKGD